MGGTYLHFPKSYEIDDYYFVLIIRFVRYEIIANEKDYIWRLGLKQFVADMEREHWYVAPERVVDFSRYCGAAKTYPEFVDCLKRVRNLLMSFGDNIPSEWREKLKVHEDDFDVPIHYPPKTVIYWLDCLRQAVDDYQPFIGVKSFPFPPISN